MGSYRRFPKSGAPADAARRSSHEWLEQQFREAMRLSRPAEMTGASDDIAPFELENAERLRQSPAPTRH